ncbi:MAG: transposase [Lactobacillus sp.]|nr:MAG: transposase [Lactobacillus sp.]
MLTHRYDITYERWDQIKSLFPIYVTGHQVIHDNRTMFNAILWPNRTSAPCRDFPQLFGPWESFCTRLTR